MGAPIIGRQRYLGYAKEITRNIANLTPTRWFPFSAFSPNTKPEYMADKQGFGSRNAMNKKFLAVESFETKLEIMCYANQVGEFLFHFFGQVTTTQDGTTGAYEHTFTNRESTELPTFTVFYTGEDGQNYYAYGCQVVDLDFTVPTKAGEPMVGISIMGLAEVIDVTPRTPSYTQSETILMGRHLVTSYADTVALLSGALGTNPAIGPVRRFIQNFKIGFKNNTTPDESYNGGALYDMNAQQVDYEMTFSEVIRDNLAKNWEKAQIRKAWRVKLENTSAGFLGSSPTWYPMLQFTFGRSLAEINKPDNALDSLVMLDYKIEAERDIVGGIFCQVRLRNTTPSY